MTAKEKVMKEMKVWRNQNRKQKHGAMKWWKNKEINEWRNEGMKGMMRMMRMMRMNSMKWVEDETKGRINELKGKEEEEEINKKRGWRKRKKMGKDKDGEG